ncbi:hypothetical protein, partial [Chimaeribacter arupi]|uniref:hypothetical protein n=1 Tax=Chimaeribacter arupi TaxID=2060066 RepID=UPI0019D458CF
PKVNEMLTLCGVRRGIAPGFVVCQKLVYHHTEYLKFSEKGGVYSWQTPAAGGFNPPTLFQKYRFTGLTGAGRKR